MSCLGFLFFKYHAVSFISSQCNGILRLVFGLEKKGVFLRMLIGTAVSHQNACSVDWSFSFFCFLFLKKWLSITKYCYLTARARRLWCFFWVQGAIYSWIAKYRDLPTYENFLWLVLRVCAIYGWIIIVSPENFVHLHVINMWISMFLISSLLESYSSSNNNMDWIWLEHG